MPETKEEAPGAEQPGMAHVTEKLNLLFTSGVKVSERPQMLAAVAEWLVGHGYPDARKTMPGTEQPGTFDPVTAAQEKWGGTDAPLDLHEFPSAIRAALAELHESRKPVSALKDALKQAEDDLREVIRPHHSNDKQRDAAFRAQKESDPAWAEANANLQQTLDVIAALEGEVEELRGSFAVALLQTFNASGAASHPAMKPLEVVLRIEAGHSAALPQG